MIIGLTGKFAAGKGTVADVLGREGYSYHSLSDVLRDELAERGIDESRDALRVIGNELRRAGGPGVLAARVLARIEARGEARALVDSIRNPAEVEVLRRRADFVMVGVDADPRIRFERLRARDRQGDPETWEDFVELEARETVSDDPATQQLRKTFELADVVVANDGTIEALRLEVSELLRRLEKRL